MPNDPGSTAADGDTVDARMAAAGDARAFERLYRGHVGRVQGLARRMMGTEEVHDLTQEVFVRAWQKLGTFRGDAAFGTWLHRLAINWILSRRSQSRLERERRVEGDAVLENLAGRPVPPEGSMDFEAAIARLPKGARHIFVLHDVHGFQHQEIARMLRITAGTSKAQLHRARMLLRGHLSA